ncbi:ABC transporter ATP-binding protein [Corynebacterium uberis]|uniref:ABC transporter ATP-binding protein n=1 Tax=Corynebacterium TaxID=1716 RepID=UPI001D0B8FC7|nr:MULTISPECIES: ABC transporter ATP-binding protein [Corynebacterium]MCZ9310190.1 ABC transporter ATP-binding protein [Corynebacterium sp. c6VSa_13]UDL73328.1 ABC transporter ATP-binding protein [Corynebacterium uberis]UDL75794.1 ABC transporter ATP-binding protein [Corynebacterium uberis]UDL78007.1 ABC transporter ATP-binding protein [Corynebacterium uberis]UDL80289.1 ABC transporter ATP-binding protein [Corynebacterium uberis]
MSVLVAEHLTRTFGKPGHQVEAVRDVSFQVDAGQIVGLVGPNGAGKTTMVRMCSTLLRPTAGQIRIAGVDAVECARQARAHVGVVLGGDQGFYMRSSAWANLLFFADVAGVPRAQRRHRVEEALAAVSLTDRARDRVDAFSRGMRQRLHIARGLLGRPELMLLDEPTNGLDPVIAAQIRSLIKSLSSAGVAVVLTTHLMAEMEQLASQIVVLAHGQVRARGSAAQIAQAAALQAVSTFELTDAAGADQVARLESHPAVARVEVESFSGRCVGAVSWSDSPDEGAVAGVPGVAGLHTRRPTLEESYLALVGQQGD